MSIEIAIPDLGNGSPEAMIIMWHKKVGEAVKAGEVLVEVMTEKVNVEIESTVDGVIVEILVPEEAMAPAGSVIGRIVQRAQQAEEQ